MFSLPSSKICILSRYDNREVATARNSPDLDDVLGQISAGIGNAFHGTTGDALSSENDLGSDVDDMINDVMGLSPAGMNSFI